MSDRLFDPGPLDDQGPPDDDLSAGARLTRKNNQMLANGRHPGTGLRLTAVEGATCGNCTHSYRRGEPHKGWWKCELVPVTFGPGTDIRKKWPGCTKWEMDVEIREAD